MSDKGITAELLNRMIEKVNGLVEKPDTYQCRCSLCGRTVFVTGFIPNPIICPLCEKKE